MGGQEPGEVQAAPEPEQALSAVVSRLRAELAGLRRAMRSRAVIEQAKGVLGERLGVGPDSAFDQMVRLSQRSNVKLVEVAAALVGTTAPDPQVPGVPDVLDDELRSYLARQRSRSGRRRDTKVGDTKPASHPPRPAAVEALQAQHQLLAARVMSARSYDEIAATIAETRTGWPPPATVVLALLEPDGALRVVGSDGLAPQTRSQWSRIPPQVDLPLTVTARDRMPLWLGDADTLRRRFPALGTVPYPSESMATMPLLDPYTDAGSGRVIGVLSVTWETPQPFDDDTRRYLYALGEPCARRVLELLDQPAPAVPPHDERAWLPIVLENVLEAAALLAPVWEVAHGGDDSRSRIVDFRYEYVNAAARRQEEAAGVDFSDDATLLSLHPELGSRVLLPEFIEVLRTGEPRQLDDMSAPAGEWGAAAGVRSDVHVARLWDRVLVLWRVHSEADLLHEQLLEGERIARTGSFFWDLRRGEVRWSPEMYRLFHRSRRDGPLPLEDASGYVHADDWYAYQRALRATLLSAKAMALEFRYAADPARRLRLTGEPVTDAGGETWAVRGTISDVTSERAVQARLRRTEEALAAQRERLDAERGAAEALQRALLPVGLELLTTTGLVVRGLCRPAEKTGRVSGDWFDVFGLPDDSTVLVVGDVAGAGLPAAVAGARLRDALRAYAVTGLSPAEVLGALNVMLCHLNPEQLATVTIARYEPAGRVLRWAAAGQAAPTRYLPGGDASPLTGPSGLPIGVTLDRGYEESTVELRAGERLLLHTDGLVTRRESGFAEGVDALRDAARHTDLDDVEALVDYITERVGSLPNDDMCLIVARATR